MITIAIDGYSSTGKSTMAKVLAARLGIRYIDSGAMYRAVTLYALNEGMIDDVGTINVERLASELQNVLIDFKVTPDGRQITLLNGTDVENRIREMSVSRYVSKVAAIPVVREEMVRQQRKLGEIGSVVMDGRDIGTTVFPDARLKVFVTASPEIRAERRYKELQAKGDSSSLEEILENLRQRDHLDETRKVSPLKKASDAIVLDNSHMTVEEQNDFLYNLALERMR